MVAVVEGEEDACSCSYHYYSTRSTWLIISSRFRPSKLAPPLSNNWIGSVHIWIRYLCTILKYRTNIQISDQYWNIGLMRICAYANTRIWMTIIFLGGTDRLTSITSLALPLAEITNTHRPSAAFWSLSAFRFQLESVRRTSLTILPWCVCPSKFADDWEMAGRGWRNGGKRLTCPSCECCCRSTSRRYNHTTSKWYDYTLYGLLNRGYLGSSIT